MNQQIQESTAVFIGVSRLALMVGAGSYVIGLWNATMQLKQVITLPL